MQRTAYRTAVGSGGGRYPLDRITETAPTVRCEKESEFPSESEKPARNRSTVLLAWLWPRAPAARPIRSHAGTETIQMLPNNKRLLLLRQTFLFLRFLSTFFSRILVLPSTRLRPPAINPFLGHPLRQPRSRLLFFLSFFLSPSTSTSCRPLPVLAQLPRLASSCFSFFFCSAPGACASLPISPPGVSTPAHPLGPGKRQHIKTGGWSGRPAQC